MIVPVPKNKNATELNDFRPVALTCWDMKVFETVVLKQLRRLIPAGHDSYQFAYQKNRCTDDALSILFHRILTHLEQKDSYARVLFVDFSSAFNTIVPVQLYEKLLSQFDLPTTLCKWIHDFLLGRVQRVRIGSKYSSPIVINTGTPQGCVLSPTLFTLFTSD